MLNMAIFITKYDKDQFEIKDMKKLSTFERIRKVFREFILSEYVDEAYIQGICDELLSKLPETLALEAQTKGFYLKTHPYLYDMKGFEMYLLEVKNASKALVAALSKYDLTLAISLTKK